jgi:hypothetical protein
MGGGFDRCFNLSLRVGWVAASSMQFISDNTAYNLTAYEGANCTQSIVGKLDPSDGKSCLILQTRAQSIYAQPLFNFYM